MKFTRLALLIAFGAAALPAQAQEDFSIHWHTIDCGGGQSTQEEFLVTATIGQPDAGEMMGPESVETFSLKAGYWSLDGTTPCYANCDQSWGAPLLTANDFMCFLNAYAAGNPSANCDGSTESPILTGNDLVCFLNTYAAGCP